MSVISLFDVIGPNMVGPSSSHTAGAAAMAKLAREMFLSRNRGSSIDKVAFTLYGSFARTYKGHGTDRALLGGVLGFETDDLRIRDAFSHAEEAGLSYEFLFGEDEGLHPNTADIHMEGKDGGQLFVRGASLGGGKVKILRLNQIEVDFTGEYGTLIVSQTDRQGVAAHITRVLNECGVNIAFMRIFREAKGAAAYTIVESDGEIPGEVADLLRKNPYITDVMLL